MKLKIFYKYILIIIGLFMFSAFVWLRFIRERLPKDIPFHLSLIRFLILVEICCIYGYILYSLFKKSYTINPTITYIIDQVYKPLIAFDSFLKDFSKIQDVYLKFMVFLSYKLAFAFIDTSIFYFVFAILPRLILVSALVIDTFYFHKLFYIYKVLLIGILLFLNRYIIYSFKHVKEFLTTQKEPYVSNITMEYIHYIYLEIYGEEDEDDEDVDEEDKGWIPPTMCIPLRRFIEIQTNAIVYNNKRYRYIAIPSELAWKEIRIKYNLKSTEDIPMAIIQQENKETKLQINNLVQLSIIIEYYNITNTTDGRYKTIKKLIFTNYLLCWLYILITSTHTLSSTNIIILLDIISSILFAIVLTASYIYTYMIIKCNKKNKENKNKETKSKDNT